MEGVKIRKFRASDLGAIGRIAKSLHPEWFTEEALKNIPRDIQFTKCFVAEKDERIIGFISVYSDLGKPMIGWIGVNKKLRGRGIGRQLVEFVESVVDNFLAPTWELHKETEKKCDNFVILFKDDSGRHVRK